LRVRDVRNKIGVCIGQVLDARRHLQSGKLILRALRIDNPDQFHVQLQLAQGGDLRQFADSNQDHTPMTRVQSILQFFANLFLGATEKSEGAAEILAG